MKKDNFKDLLAQRTLELKARQLWLCDKLLTAAGVPEWVMLEANNGVPGNTVPCRLEWFLLRRKDVTPAERLLEDKAVHPLNQLPQGVKLCWLCGGTFLAWVHKVKRVVACDVPGGKKCKPKQVSVHYTCWMDMDQ